MPPRPRAGTPVARGLAAGGWGPPRAEGCRGSLSCSPISRLKAVLRATVAKGSLRWEVGQTGSPAAGGCGSSSLPPPGREWRPATEARPAACSPASPGGYGWGATGAGPGRDRPMGRGYSTVKSPPGKWRGRGLGVKFQAPEQWKACLGTRAAQGQFGAQSQDRGTGRCRLWPPPPGAAGPALTASPFPGSAEPHARLRRLHSATCWTPAARLACRSRGSQGATALACLAWERLGNEFTHLGSSGFGAGGNRLFKNT